MLAPELISNIRTRVLHTFLVVATWMSARLNSAKMSSVPISNPKPSDMPKSIEEFGEWSDESARERMDFIIAEGKQASSEFIRASLPQSMGKIKRGCAAPRGLDIADVAGATLSLDALLDKDARDGKVSVLNFGSYT